MRRAWQGLGVLLLALGVAPSAGAQPPPPQRGTLSWEAPAGCPTEEVVRAQIVALLASAPGAGSQVSARAQVTKTAKWHLHFRLEVDGKEETRDLDAASCADLATATATLVAIAVSPAAPPAASAAVDPSARLLASADAIVPAPPSGPPGLPLESARTEGGAAPASRPTPAPPSPSPHDPRFAVDALIGGTTGAVGTPALALGASAAYLTAHTRGELGILWSPLTTVETTNDVGTLGGVYSLGVGVARGCYTFSSAPFAFARSMRVTAGPCANAEGGYLYARGEGSALSSEASKTRGWAGVGAGGLLTVGGPVLAIRLQLEAVVPLANTHFVFDGASQVETPWPVVPRALLGAEVHFP